MKKLIAKIETNRRIELRALGGVADAAAPRALDGGAIEARMAAALPNADSDGTPASIHGDTEEDDALLTRRA